MMIVIFIPYSFPQFIHYSILKKKQKTEIFHACYSELIGFSDVKINKINKCDCVRQYFYQKSIELFVCIV